MIKRWFQFINESNHYWLNNKEIIDIFSSLKDEGYTISVKKSLFMEQDDDIISLNPEDDIISLKEEYYFGFQILIEKSKEKGDDVTLDFKSAINYLKNEGYEINKIFDEEGLTSVDSLHFVGGSIITWIPKKSGKPLTFDHTQFEDGDTFISSVEISINIYQPEKVEIVAKDLAEIYNWSNYTTDNDGNIYCELDIEDMVDNFLPRNSSWKDELVNGIEEGNYYSSEYQPNITSLFNYSLNKENEILAVKSLIKELGGLGGLEEFIKECDNENLEGKSEEEVINFLLKERFYTTLEPLCIDSEIIGDIRQTIGDWQSQAHCERNQEEIEEEFDRLIRREGIEFTKSRKEGQRYFYHKIPGTDRKEKVYYDEIVWFYKLKFQERWITDYEKALPNYSLRSVFGEWCSDCYFESRMDPRFSDSGDVDRVALNTEINSILKRFLAK
jgi:hypothetical protein